jgi:Ca-activated chloride channel homolog
MSFTSFTPLLWTLLLLGAAWGYWHSLVDRPAGLKLASFLLRVLGVILLALALCQPFIGRESDELHVVFAVDVSQSVDLPAAKAALKEVESGIKTLRAGDGHSLFTLGNGLRSKTLPDFTKMLEDWSNGVADDAYRAHSRIGESLLAARLAFPAGKARRLVLFSDGLETGSGIEAALDRLREESVDVRYVSLKSLSQPEAAILGVESAAPRAFQGEMLRITARVVANQAMTAKVRLINRGVAMQEKPVSLKAGEEIKVWFDAEMNNPGPSVWGAEILPEKDHFPINNQATATITVQGKPRLLILHEDDKRMRPFSRALKEQNFDVEVRGKRGLPSSMEDLAAFDAVMIADLPATDMTPRQMNLLRSYVTDFGGGLIMTGSDNSFGLGGYYKSPVEEVLPLVSRYEKEKEKPSLAMALVIDRSGSMSGLPLQMARQAAKSAAELLGQQDQIAVIAFDGDAQVVCDMTPASQLGTIQASIDSIAEGGGTFMYSGMVAAKDILDRTTAKVKHMICLTDGQTQEADHMGLVRQLTDSGVTVSTVALGDGASGELLKEIAQAGKGRFYEAAEAESLPQIFTKETSQASKSAVREGVFDHIGITEHAMLSGFAPKALPVTLGFIMTEAKPTAQVLLGAESGDPLLAVGRFGLGIGLAYTGDLTETWGGEWLAWDGCGPFWAQVLRSVLRKADVAGLSTRGELRDGTWIMRMDRQDEDGQPLSGIRWDAQLLDETGTFQTLKPDEIGLGSYELRIPVANAKHLSLRLHDKDHDKLEVKHFHAPYPAEYRLDGKPAAALASLASYQPAALTDGIAAVQQLSPISYWFVWAGMLCLLAGVVLRRV